MIHVITNVAKEAKKQQSMLWSRWAVVWISEGSAGKGSVEDRGQWSSWSELLLTSSVLREVPLALEQSRSFGAV